jgi:pyruvate/2-oxoglutarate dehydrogenase complex dihydrolipoamide dehydrogenase (E3) component
MTAFPAITTFDLIVIGGGTAGMTVARQVAKADKRVVLIEVDRTGGDCLYTGCVPSKTLLASAKRLHQIRQATAFGINVGDITLDWAAVQDRRRDAIATIEVHDSPDALKRAGIEVLSGSARFVEEHTVSVGNRHLHAPAIVLATGSVPTIPEIMGLDTTDPRVHTSETLMESTTLPKRLAVIGGGPVGVELGQAFSRFGSQVTILGRNEQLLPESDPEMSSLLTDVLEREGITICTGAELIRADHLPAEHTVVFRHRSGVEETLTVDAILIATGRTPRTAGLDLDVAGVEETAHGIAVDDHLRTRTSGIWACGDVIGPPFYTHVADDQARAVARNVLGGRATWNGDSIPWATFGDPECAGVGLSEDAARAKYGDRLEVLRFPYSALDRAITDGDETGLIKVLLAPGWTRGMLGGSVVGAHACGERASEIVQQFAFLMAWKLPAGLLAKTVQAYPSYGLGARQAVGLHWRNSSPGSRSLISCIWRLLKP